MKAWPVTSPGAARPVLKWAGGKQRLVPRILALLPEKIGTYYEPFAGSAAVLFALAAEGRFERAILADKNRELVDFYRAVQGDVAGVIEALSAYRHGEAEYYRARDLDPRKLSLAKRAARFLFLNRTGYNGLYRVNRSGQFNVPFGRYKNPRFLDPDRLATASRLLTNVRIVRADFPATCRTARAGDAVYFDPPYVPVSRTASFTAYHQEPFGMDRHERLAELFAELSARGVCTVLSNSDTAGTRRLYRRWKPQRILVTRSINSDASKRGAVTELLVATSSAPQRRRTSPA